ncbi:MAG: lamin tail domain-containing protein [bacterium]|jgi:hypothetical protein|nr:lamin tail domain-containing protein [bacterium]
MLHRLALASLLTALSAQASVVINEIHYNPAAAQGADTAYEFIELYNTAPEPVDLSGWQFTAGIAHTFAAGIQIPAGGYLVVGVNAASLEAWYGISGVVQWTSGALDNGGETLRLADAGQNLVDEVPYDDAGCWPTAPDGDGPSLELVHHALDNSLCQSWAASAVANGTPGARNSVFAADTPPQVQDLGHLPQSPGTADPLTVSVSITDDAGVATALLRYTAGGPELTAVLADQGGGHYSVQIGPFAEGTLLEVIVEAEDTAGQITVHPAPLGPEAYHIFISDHHPTDSDIVINEIQYTDACYGGLDWFELHNTTGTPLDLSFWTVKDDQDDHIFTIPGGTTISAGGYLVVAQDAAQVMSNHGIANVVGNVSFGLGSGGDAVRLFDVNLVLVDAVTYGVSAPWPGPPVGSGPSLSLIDPALDNSLGENWAASAEPCGTPGTDNHPAALVPPALSIAYDGGQIILTWTVVEEALAYRVEAADVLGGAFTTLATTPDTNLQVNINPAQPLRLLRVIALR